ncbi:MAG: hypothetical protein ABGY96_22940 [bacterium]|nr:hypothetical protein [Gammaproteobacteria bacterium]HIL94690.1 hypothetical protein [Pseudomonadales bacterium]
MNLQRFSQIINAYGAKIESWPIEERHEAAEFLQRDREAQKLIKAEMLLDQQLDDYSPGDIDVSRLTNSIVTAIVEHTQSGLLSELQSEPQPKNEPTTLSGFLDHLLDWLLPVEPIQFWRPALAASLPLIVGGLLGMSIDTSQFDSSDYWEDELEIMAIASSTSLNEEYPYE